VADTILPGQGLRPFKLTQRDKDRLYSRIFELLGHSSWKEKDHQKRLLNALFEQASSWAAPRVFFDAAIGYLTHQKIEAKRETFRTRHSSKYFGTSKGVSAISLNANHMAINARVIGANEHESHFIFDLLMNNSTEIIPDVLSTDTHGVNHVNFALLDLFGYQFALRYARVGKVIDDLFEVKKDKDSRVQLSLKMPINTKRIIDHWDTIQRTGVSLSQRKTTQATLVRKPSGYKNNHLLMEAITEYNRMIKAQFLLSYIDDADLCNHVKRALNRGEAYTCFVERSVMSTVTGSVATVMRRY
jgi:TnpA family transposase